MKAEKAAIIQGQRNRIARLRQEILALETTPANRQVLLKSLEACLRDLQAGEASGTAMNDLILNVTFFLLICMSVMSFSKAQQVYTVKVPELTKQETAVSNPQGLREKHVVLLKSGELLSESKPLKMADVGKTILGASTVFIEADKEGTLGRYLELQEEISKSVGDIRVLAKEKRNE